MKNKTVRPSIEELRKEFGRNKTIPEKYDAAILVALSHYPELKDTKIVFRLRNNHPVPYGTKPALLSVLRKRGRRTYVTTILEKAGPPLEHALLKHLTFRAKVGVFGHEAAHVVQYEELSRPELLKALIYYLKPSFQRKMERAADIAAILHGLGRQLLEHAVYIRSIPGYVQERKEINRNYLKPKEIREYLKSDEFFHEEFSHGN